jgi:hypothetical protein
MARRLRICMHMARKKYRHCLQSARCVKTVLLHARVKNVLVSCGIRKSHALLIHLSLSAYTIQPANYGLLILKSGVKQAVVIVLSLRLSAVRRNATTKVLLVVHKACDSYDSSSTSTSEAKFISDILWLCIIYISTIGHTSSSSSSSVSTSSISVGDNSTIHCSVMTQWSTYPCN